MKKVLFIFTIFFSFGLNAQNIDEIINSYFENVGGKENWSKIEGLYTKGKMKMQGMEIPFDSYQFKDGRSAQIANFQGKEMTFLAFDGKIAWGVNFMNMKAEKKNDETIETLQNATKEFPSVFLNYKENGFELTLDGEKDIDGTPTFKVKLVKDSVSINGQKFPSIEYIYFDQESFVPIMKEAAIPVGPMAGQVAETYLGNYQEVDGLYFPFEMSSKINGQVMQSMIFDEYKINPEVDSSIFAFPVEQVEEVKEVKDTTVNKTVKEQK